MTDAQVHINKFARTCTEIEVESLGPTNTPDWKKITDKLTGSLVIKNYPELEKIKLEGHELEGVIIINCPKLTNINVKRNKLTELDIIKVKTTDDSETGDPSSNKLESIVCGGNPNLEGFSAEHCLELKKILASGSSKINRIPGLDKLENLEEIIVTKGLFGSIFPEKIKYFREVVEIMRKNSGFSPDEPLPSIIYTDSDGKVKKKIDKNALETKLKDEIASGYSQLETDKENVEKERDAAQAKLEAQKDYDEIKAERDQLKQNFQAIIKKLGLAEQSTQDQILTKIEELMSKPDNDNSDKVSDLERQLSEKNQRISTLESEKNELVSKQNIVENLKDSFLTLSETKQAEIVNASSSQEAWKIRDQAIKEKFGELNQAQRNAFYLNVILGSLTFLSLLLVAYLVIWKINPTAKKDEIPSQPKKKEKLKS